MVGTVASVSKHIVWKSIAAIPNLLGGICRSVYNLCTQGIKPGGCRFGRDILADSIPVISPIIFKGILGMRSYRETRGALHLLQKRLGCLENIPGGDEQNIKLKRQITEDVQKSLNEANELICRGAGTFDLRGCFIKRHDANYKVRRLVPFANREAEYTCREIRDCLFEGRFDVTDSITHTALAEEMNGSLATGKYPSFEYHLPTQNPNVKMKPTMNIQIELAGYSLLYNKAAKRLQITLRQGFREPNPHELKGSPQPNTNHTPTLVPA